LEKRGFNELKKEVLRTVIHHGPLLASEIATQNSEEIHTVYNALNRLRKSSLIGRRKEARGTGKKRSVWVYFADASPSMYQRALRKLEWYDAT